MGIRVIVLSAVCFYFKKLINFSEAELFPIIEFTSQYCLFFLILHYIWFFWLYGGKMRYLDVHYGEFTSAGFVDHEANQKKTTKIWERNSQLAFKTRLKLLIKRLPMCLLFSSLPTPKPEIPYLLIKCFKKTQGLPIVLIILRTTDLKIWWNFSFSLHIVLIIIERPPALEFRTFGADGDSRRLSASKQERNLS